MIRRIVVVLALIALAACTTPRDGQQKQVDPKAFQIWVVGF